MADRPQIAPGVPVLVLRGPAVGAIGTAKRVCPFLESDLDGVVWEVEFDRPVECFSFGRALLSEPVAMSAWNRELRGQRTVGVLVAFEAAHLLPLPPDASLDDTTVVQQLHNPITSQEAA